jgi:hypothetical protein
MQIKHSLIVSLGLTLLSSAAWSETYSEMAQRNAQMRMAEQSRGATVIYLQVPPGAGPQAPYPATGGAMYQPYPAQQAYAAPRLIYGVPTGSTLNMLPAAGSGLPNQRQIRWSYGQVNASSDPFNAWGLSNQGMYVPWSTPMSAWANSESWNWWRTRAGDSGPPPPLW